MPKKINIIGKKFSKLKVLSQWSERCGERRRTFCQCVCDCGNPVRTLAISLRNGRASSCGCLQAYQAAQRLRTHGMSYSREYSVWRGIIQRCTNEKSPEYKNYGGRGITVCSRWKDSFVEFYQDVGDMPNGTEIDRIDNNGNYNPGNVRFASSSENSRNTRTSRRWFAPNGHIFEAALDGAIFFGVGTTTFYGWCRGYEQNGKFHPPKDGFRSEPKYIGSNK